MSNTIRLVRGPTQRGRRRLRALLMLAVAASLLMVGASMLPATAQPHNQPHQRTAYVENAMVSDQPGVAPVTDPNLVNAWGLSAGPASPLWVSDNGTDKTTLYRGAVGGAPFSIVPLVVAIPGGKPTGQVFNASGAGFLLDTPNGKVPSAFLFASESGNITAWNGMLMPNTSAVIKATTAGAIYKGLAIATTKKGTFLYAADFHNNRIDVFDSNFEPVDRPYAFRDPHIPRGFAPFNVQSLDGKLYVTYAKQDADAEDDVRGPGNGFVDVFSNAGVLLDRLVSRGPLNSPWGLAIAPDNFGTFSHALLIGNFGDGKIHAFDPHSGRFLGTVRDKDHKALQIDGLWGLKFGNGVDADTNALIFSAGPDDEAHGLLGTITMGS